MADSADRATVWSTAFRSGFGQGHVAGSTSYPPPMFVDDPDSTPGSRDNLARGMVTVCYAGRPADRRRGCEEEYKYERDDAIAWGLLLDYVRVGGALRDGEQDRRRVPKR